MVWKSSTSRASRDRVLKIKDPRRFSPDVPFNEKKLPNRRVNQVSTANIPGRRISLRRARPHYAAALVAGYRAAAHIRSTRRCLSD
jgi:hypothetical protein